MDSDGDRTGALPWAAKARGRVQAAGLDPRYVRRFRWLHKARAVRRSEARMREHLLFVLADPEPDNFTYQLANLDALVRWVDAVTGCGSATAQAYVSEPDSDAVLRHWVRAATSGRFLWTKAAPPFGKRVGWYALTRALGPRLTIETGVQDGLSSLLLLRALERNAEEGRGGRLVSFEVNPAGGWLVGRHPAWELRVESSGRGLPCLLDGGPPVDLFVYDGWHAYEAERADLLTALEHLSRRGILVSDDAQMTGALAGVCTAAGLSYHEFAERPRDHFYPGSVLGAGCWPSAVRPATG